MSSYFAASISARRFHSADTGITTSDICAPHEKFCAILAGRTDPFKPRPQHSGETFVLGADIWPVVAWGSERHGRFVGLEIPVIGRGGHRVRRRGVFALR